MRLLEETCLVWFHVVQIQSTNIVQRTFKFLKPDYELFKDKVKAEGYTVDEAINYLIRKYISE